MASFKKKKQQQVKTNNTKKINKNNKNNKWLYFMILSSCGFIFYIFIQQQLLLNCSTSSTQQSILSSFNIRSSNRISYKENNNNNNNDNTIIISSSSSSNTNNYFNYNNNKHSNNHNNIYELAYKQSYGFFYDIDEYNWKLKQKRTRTRIHHHFPNDPLKFYNEPNRWYLNNFEPDFTCGQEWRVLGPGDGPKWVCDPHRLKEIVQHPRHYHDPNIDNNNIDDNDNNNNIEQVEVVDNQQQEQQQEQGCLIYSIGSRGKFEFEDGIIKLLNSTNVCEIHVFDPQDWTKERGGYLQLQKEYNIYYHKWGFTSSYDKSYKPIVKKGEFISLQETLIRLNHTNRIIDIFKIDCEGCEWYCYKDWFTIDIRMLLIETHNLPTNKNDIMPYFYSFQQHNYFMFHKEPNIHPKAAGNGIEWGYIKLHNDFAPYNITLEL